MKANTNNRETPKEKSPQFKRTDAAIVKAMISLLEKNTFEQITVQDILDETPVSRGTFYAHYEDKYQLAKSMLDQYMDYYLAAPQEYIYTTKEHYGDLSKRMALQNYQLVQALMKVHTDDVNLFSTLSEHIEKEYLSSISNTSKELHPHLEDEAHVYALAMVALQMNFLNHAYSNDIDNYFVDDVIIPALLHFLHLDDDMETRRFLTRKLDVMEKNRTMK